MLVRPWGPSVMMATTMRQVAACPEPPCWLAGLLADARAPLNLPSTARAYGCGPCVLNTWYAFTCAPLQTLALCFAITVASMLMQSYSQTICKSGRSADSS